MTKLNRRDFFKAAARMSITAGAAMGMGMPNLLQAAAKPDLAVVTGRAEAAIDKAVSLLGGWSSFINSGDKVLIKPNISFPQDPSVGATTSTEVIAAVVKGCLKAGASKIIIADYPLRAPEESFRKAKMEEIATISNKVSAVMATRQSLFQEYDVKSGKSLKSCEVLTLYDKCERLILVPTAKSHGATGVSFSLKGNMGLIWDRHSFHNRFDLDQAIADLASILTVTLVIMDATRALLTGGPGGPGQLKQLNTIIAGTDLVAVDSYTASLAPWYGKSLKGFNVPHIYKAFQMGLGKIDTAKMSISKGSV